jgi:Na+-driven multidrug efflux pump
MHLPSYGSLIRFAVPVMLAAIATPLMGMVDTAVLDARQLQALAGKIAKAKGGKK